MILYQLPKLNTLLTLLHINKIFFNSTLNGRNSYLLVNGLKIYHFKANNSELFANPLCSGNISKDFSVPNMKKTGINGYVYDFSVDYFDISFNNIIDIHEYLMKKNKKQKKKKM